MAYSAQRDRFVENPVDQVLIAKKNHRLKKPVIFSLFVDPFDG